MAVSIGSDAFRGAAQRSDHVRTLGMLAVCAAFAVFVGVNAVADRAHFARYAMFFCWWGVLAAYEGVLLSVTARARRTGRPLATWVWVGNTVIECVLPSLALMGLTADKEYLGPYRALVS